MLGAVPPAGSACSGQHILPQAVWRILTLGQPAPSEETWNSAGNQPGKQLSIQTQTWFWCPFNMSKAGIHGISGCWCRAEWGSGLWVPQFC